MGHTLPVVSIITPVFRSEEILARALGGLLSQGLRDWEAIIVDDGSPDASWRVVQAYSWMDSRIRVLRQKHGGACAARNTGIADARGDYLLFLDADDWLEPGALQALASACEANQAAAAHGQFRFALPDGAPTNWLGGCPPGQDLFGALCGSNVLSVPSSVLLRKSVLDEIGTFDTSLVHCGDWDLWGRLGRFDAPVAQVNELVTSYRMSPGSLSRNPLSLLRDATTVLRRLHASDSRVKRPNPKFASGADPAELDSRVAHFAVYAAALAVAGGQPSAVGPVLDRVPRWPTLSMTRAGEMIFYALCFARCRAPESFAEFWPQLLGPVRQMLDELQRRTGVPSLSDQLWNAMDRCIEGRLSTLPLPLPEPVRTDETPPEPIGFDTRAHHALRTLARGR